MKFLVLMGSPRLQGNTAHLCRPFMQELEEVGAQVKYITVADKAIAPCRGCYACQNVQEGYGCVQKDDMSAIADAIYRADCIVLASPIYTWYCPAEMKALLDRHYGMNKFYGSATGSLWQGKSLALLLTHGYDEQFGAEPFVKGMKSFCIHTGIPFLGVYSVRDEDDLTSFTAPEAVAGAKRFARELIKKATTPVG